MRIRSRAKSRVAVALTSVLVAAGLVAAGAAPAHAAAEDGVYTGENSHGYDISITVEDGAVTNVDTVATVFCVSGTIAVPFPTQFIGNPTVPIEADGSFAADWTYDVDQDITNHYWIGGVISGDTITSAGSNAADMTMVGMGCSGSQFTYTAVRDGDPAPSPTMTVTPNPITPEQYRDPGLTVRGENFVPNTQVDFAVNGIVLGQAPVDAGGNVDITNTWSEATLGDHVLRISGNGRSAEATVTVTEDPVDPDPVYDPEVSVAPGSVTVSGLADPGVVVSGSGFPEEAAAEVLFGGAVVAEVTTNADGAVSQTVVREGVAAGSYPVVVRSGDWSAQASLTVTEDPGDPDPVYDPEVSVTPGSVSVSGLADPGIVVSGADFPEDAAAEVLFDGAVVAEVTTDADGGVSHALVREGVAAGSYAVVVRSGDWSAEASLTVTEDPVVYDPEASVAPGSVTVSGLADGGVVVSGAGFPEDAAAEVLFDGAVVAEVTTDADGAVTHELVRVGVAAGSYPVVVRSGDWSAQASLTVTEDPVVVYDPEASVTPGSVTVSGLAGDGVVVSGSGFPEDAAAEVLFDGAVVAEVTTDADGAVAHTLVREGVAAGSYPVVVRSGDWSAQASLTVTEDPVDPDPVYEPEVLVAPGSVTVSGLAGDGVVVSGAGFPEDAAAELLFDGAVVAEVTTDADGAVSQTMVREGVAAGSYPIVVRSGDWSAQASLTVIEDPVDPDPVYDPKVSVAPGSVTVSGLAGDGVVVSGAGFPEDAAAELLFDGAVVAEVTTDADGAVAHTLVREGIAAGSYPVVVRSGDWSAQASLTVTEDPVDPVDPDPITISLSVGSLTQSQLSAEGVLVAGAGLAPGAEARVLLDGEELARLTADGSGSVEYRIVGLELAVGEYVVELISGDQSASATLTVTADEPVVPDPDGPSDPDDPKDPNDPGTVDEGDDDLASTGEDLAWLRGAGVLAALLLSLGALLAWRRHGVASGS